MPDELLQSYSSESLANLVLDYPFLVDALVFATSEQAMYHFKKSSNIFKEFLAREDSMEILLKKYEDLSVDYSMLAESYTGNSKNELLDSGYIKEIFLQTYFADKALTMNTKEKRRLAEIIGEKYELKKGLCDDYATGLLIYDQIQKMNGEISLDLIPTNILNDAKFETNQTGNLSNFVSSGTYTTVYGVTHTIGTYTKYNKTSGCYKYYSGDFDSTEKKKMNDAFDIAHPSWTRTATATAQYNCHSYSWIDTSSSNVYWLNSPDTFSSSSSLTYIGHMSNASYKSGDKIVVEGSKSSSDGFGNYIYALHSMNVTSNAGSTSSKLGAYGVYTAPLMDIFNLYSGFTYAIYR